MKKIMDRPEDIVSEMCRGIVMADPKLVLDETYRVIARKEKKEKVILISGGGSGHEPAHAGYVGTGMLDAAVCGDVFASPSQVQIYQAIRQTRTGKGTLLIIKNYSGDVMNFKNAAYLASEDGIEVDYVIVDDDIAVQDSLYTVGRRGVAGTVFVHKIAGAAAEAGASLAEVKRIAEKTASRVKSIGFALTSCTVPAKGTPTFELGGDEIEYGVGIHGEPGIRREPLQDAKTLARRMTKAVCDELQLAEGTRAAVMVNGFGATPLMELYVLYSDVAAELAARGVTIARPVVGNQMTSLDMAGASLSILALDDELEELLGRPAETAGLCVTGPLEDVTVLSAGAAAEEEKDRTDLSAFMDAAVGGTFTLPNIAFALRQMSDCIIRNEVPFCELDAHAGDGDFGMSVAKGFRQLELVWARILKENTDIGALLQDAAMVIMEHCGGASGPIWGSAFRAAGKETEGKTSLTTAEFAAMMRAALEGIQRTGERSFGRGAVVGDKTLVDALSPCVDAWAEAADAGLSFREAFRTGAAAAVEGADKTKDIVARMGRAGAVGERSIGYPDAGAYALGVIFTELAEALQEAGS